MLYKTAEQIFWVIGVNRRIPKGKVHYSSTGAIGLCICHCTDSSFGLSWKGQLPPYQLRPNIPAIVVGGQLKKIAGSLILVF